MPFTPEELDSMKRLLGTGASTQDPYSSDIRETVANKPAEVQGTGPVFSPDEIKDLRSYISPEGTQPQPSKGALSDIGRGFAAGLMSIPESAGAGMQWLGERVGSEKLKEFGETTSGYWGEKLEDYGPPAEIAGKNIIDDPKLLAEGSYWLYNVPQMLPSLAASIIPGAAAGRLISAGPKAIQGFARLGQWVASGAAGGGLEATSTYKQLLDEGVPEKEAARAAEIMFFGVAGLSALASDKILRAAGDSFKKKVVKTLGAGAWEGVTEGLEEPWEVVAALGSKFINDQPMPDDIKGMFFESLKDAATIAPVAAITGAGGAMVGGQAPAKDQQDQPDIPGMEEPGMEPPIPDEEAQAAFNEAMARETEEVLRKEGPPPMGPQPQGARVFEEGLEAAPPQDWSMMEAEAAAQQEAPLAPAFDRLQDEEVITEEAPVESTDTGSLRDRLAMALEGKRGRFTPKEAPEVAEEEKTSPAPDLEAGEVAQLDEPVGFANPQKPPKVKDRLVPALLTLDGDVFYDSRGTTHAEVYNSLADATSETDASLGLGGGWIGSDGFFRLGSQNMEDYSDESREAAQKYNDSAYEAGNIPDEKFEHPLLSSEPAPPLPETDFGEKPQGVEETGEEPGSLAPEIKPEPEKPPIEPTKTTEAQAPIPGQGVEPEVAETTPKQPAAAPETGKKEPWEMTREEYDSSGILPDDDILREIEKRRPKKPKNKGDLAALSQYDESLKAWTPEYRQALKDGHKRFVQQALSEGKPVPPEVLAEYPDLKRSTATPGTEPFTAENLPKHSATKYSDQYGNKFRVTISGGPHAGTEAFSPYSKEDARKELARLLNQREKALPHEPTKPEPAQTTEDMTAAVDEFFASNLKLTATQKQKLGKMRDQLEAEIAKPGVSEETRQTVQKRLEEIDRRLGQAEKPAKPTLTAKERRQIKDIDLALKKARTVEMDFAYDMAINDKGDRVRQVEAKIKDLNEQKRQILQGAAPSETSETAAPSTSEMSPKATKPEVSPIVSRIDNAVNQRSRSNEFVKIGQEVFPEIRLQEAEEAGMWAYQVAKGEATQEEFDAWKERMRRENRTREKPAREPARSEAIGAISLGKVHQIEEAGWEIGWADEIGEIKPKSDRYYDLTGLVAGKADAFVKKGLSIRKKEAGDKAEAPLKPGEKFSPNPHVEIQINRTWRNPDGTPMVSYAFLKKDGSQGAQNTKPAHEFQRLFHRDVELADESAPAPTPKDTSTIKAQDATADDLLAEWDRQVAEMEAAEPEPTPESTPEPEKAPAEFKEGDRVVLKNFANTYDGRHGVIEKVRDDIWFETVYGSAPKRKTDRNYNVKTDSGYVVDLVPGRNLDQETGEAPVAKPDIEVNPGEWQTPEQVKLSAKYAREHAKSKRAAAQRARKPERIAELKRSAERFEEAAKKDQAIYDAWAEEHAPEEVKKAETHPTGSLDGYGLSVEKTTTKTGKPVWQVSGNTKEHLQVMKAAGGRWYGPKKVWSFYNADPTQDILDRLPKKEPTQKTAPEPNQPPVPSSREKGKESPLFKKGERVEFTGFRNRRKGTGTIVKDYTPTSPPTNVGIAGDDGMHHYAGPDEIKRIAGAPAKPAPAPTASEKAGETVDHIKNAIDKFKEINKILGEEGALSGKEVDMSKYDMIKPLLQEAWDEIMAAGKSAREFVQIALQSLSPKGRPYFEKFVREEVSHESIRRPTQETPEREQEGDVSGSREVQGTEGVSGGEVEPRPSAETGVGGVGDAGQHGRGDSDQGTARIAPTDYRITEDDRLGQGGPKQKYRNNVAAIKLLAELKDRQATPEEQTILAKYVGWGGLPQAFPRPDGSIAKGWDAEAKELKSLLGPNEYAAARASTQDAHYTSELIIKNAYNALKRFGFKGGKTLEPSEGIGNFIGLMPDSIRNRSKITGIELDPTTAAIAKQLYPQQNHVQSGFEEVTLAPNSFDLAIGNPPFGDKTLYDPQNPDLRHFSIHNYFFAKSIKSLRPNGILAMVVSSSMMDKKGSAQREWLARHAELIGAIRLPNEAFKGNAGTEVTTDLIFLRKRAEGEHHTGHKWQRLKQVTGKDGIKYNINEYFIANPHMMLGDVAPNKLLPGEVKDGVYDAVPGLVARGEWQINLLENAIATLPEGIYKTGQTFEQVQRPDITVKDIGFVQPFGYTLDDNGQAVRRLPDVNGEMVFEPILYRDKPLEGLRLDRFKGMLTIRDTLRRLIRAEIDDSPNMGALRKRLNTVYDRFVKKYGYISSPANAEIFKGDPTDYPLLRSLEKDFEPGISKVVAKKTGEKAKRPKAEKSAIFRERTRESYRAAKKADSAKDGLAIVLREDGVVDMDRIAALTGEPIDQVIRELAGIAFENPQTKGWETAEVYLSGNVKKKLREAQTASQMDERFVENVKALEKVQPPDVPAHKIHFRIGATWIPTSVYEDFAREVLEVPAPRIIYNENTNVWSISLENGGTTRYGTSRRSAGSIYHDLLRNKDIVVYEKDDDGKRYVNMEATTQAQTKAEEMDRAFQEWAIDTEQRGTLLANMFNEKVNTTVEMKPDGSHMIFPGMGIVNVGVPRDNQLLPHQKNVVWRLIQKGKGLLDHVVGSGKTFAAIAAGLEMKRMGLLKKPLYVVPNHLVQQWAIEFQRLYPGANVLVIGKKDFAKSQRQEFLGRIATGTWDAVVIAHSSFGFIKMPRDYEMRFYGDQIQQYEEAIRELGAIEGKKSRSVKQMEKARDKLKTKLKALADKPKDNVVDFSELGVDALFVDEAHEFKNLFYATSRQRVAGLGNQQGSKKAFDMFVKTQFILEQNNGRGVFFMTGTPVSNSIAEMYTMMRYLDYAKVQEMGIKHFDQWANMFASTISDWEVDATGTRYRLQSKLEFANIPGLISFYKDFADVISTEDLKAMAEERGQTWPIPDIKGGKPAVVVAERSELQKSFMDWIVHRFDNMPSDPREDNPLKATGEAMKASLDIRLINPSLPDFEGSKVNLAVGNIIDTYKRWSDKKGAQLVFCDLSVPQKAVSKHRAEIQDLRDAIRKAETRLAKETGTGREAEIEQEYIKLVEKMEKFSPAELMAADSKFSVYDDIKAKLIAAGIPESGVAFIHDANTDMQKEQLFGKVRSGRVRVLIGSTSKMGAGMNVQDRLVALHHLDAPWRPSDLEQREGRIIRQGNLFYQEAIKAGKKFEVEIFRYSTNQTLDTRRWQIIERKAVSIGALRTGKYEWGETIPDATGEAANAAEMKAASSGNPLILKEIQLRQDIKKQEALKKGARYQRYDMERKIKEAEDFEGRYDKFRADLTNNRALIESNPRDNTPEGWQITINDQVFKAEGLVPVPEKTTSKDKEEIKANKDAIAAATEHNKKALDAAKEKYSEAIRELFESGTSLSAIVGTLNYRGVDFGVARETMGKGYFVEADLPSASRYPRGGGYIYLDPRQDVSPEGFLVRLDNLLGRMANKTDDYLDGLVEHRAKLQKSAANAKKTLEETQDFEPELERLRAEHERILIELAQTRTSDDTETPDFSMWTGRGRHPAPSSAQREQSPPAQEGRTPWDPSRVKKPPKSAIDLTKNADPPLFTLDVYGKEAFSNGHFIDLSEPHYPGFRENLGPKRNLQLESALDDAVASADYDMGKPELVRPAKDGSLPLVVFRVRGDTPININENYFNYFETKYEGNATYHSSGTPSGLVVVKHDGEVVGAMMPVQLPAEEGIRFSRHTEVHKAPRRPVRAAAVQADVSRVIDKEFKGLAGQVEVVQSEADLPADVLSQIKGEGMEGQYNGLNYRGKTYIVADNLSSRDAGRVQFIEALIGHEGRHWAFSQIIPNAFERKRFFRQVADKYQQEVKAYMDEFEETDKALAAEEVFASQVREGKTGALIDRFITKVMQWVRKVFPGIHITRAEARNLIERAEALMAGPGRTATAGSLFAQPDIRYQQAARLNQAISSAATSRRQVPAAFKKVSWEKGSVNLDIGGGKYDEGTEYLENQGVENLVYDPFNRPEDYNREIVNRLQGGLQPDTVTATNVLNVIKEADVRSNVIQQAARTVKDDGTVYFSAYQADDGSGAGKRTRDGWQENRRIQDYIPEVEQHFGEVERKGSLVIARKPLSREPAIWMLGEDAEAIRFQRKAAAFDKEHQADTISLWDTVRKIPAVRNQGWKEGNKRDFKSWQRLLSVPSHFFHEIASMGRVYNAAMENQDNRNRLKDDILKGTDEIYHTQALDILRKQDRRQYLNLKRYLKDHDQNQIGYRVVKNPDTEQFELYQPGKKKPVGKFDKEADAVDAMIKAEGDDYLRSGATEQAANALMRFRRATNNGFDILFQSMNDLIQHYKEAGMELPTETVNIDGKRVEVNLKMALAKMGDMRGYYFPRIRQPGRYVGYATKKGVNPIRKHFDYETTLGAWQIKMEHQGYQVTKDTQKRMPEDVFEMAGQVVAQEAIINEALNRIRTKDFTLEDFGLQALDRRLDNGKRDFMVTGPTTKELNTLFKKMGGRFFPSDKGGPRVWHFENPGPRFESRLAKAIAFEKAAVDVDLGVQSVFAKALVEQVANVIKGRGVRQHMIARRDATGLDVWEGYEEDPAIALAKYARGLAAGEAKKIMAKDMLAAFTGTDISWSMYKGIEGENARYEDYLEFVENRRVDPVNQPNAFKEGKTYIEHMLRNDEAVDRLTGSIKGVAVLKYLAGRVSAPIVNLTALVTSVPASMNGFGNIPLNKTFGYLAKASRYYKRYAFGDKNSLPKDVRQLFDEIHDNGWHNAQYNREALSVLRSKAGRGMDRVIDWGMIGFGVTEQLNRVATIAGAYLGLKDQGKMQHDEMLELAKRISDQAHATYGKANWPLIARGTHPAAHVMKAFYVFKTFPHNYILTMKDLWGDGWTPQHAKAFTYMALSPAILAGSGGMVGWGIIMSALAKAFDVDDPEEDLYAWLDANMGASAERFARFGAFGLIGINLKGSLEIGVTDLPTNFKDLLGAPASVIGDVYEGGKSILKGDVAKGIERIAPLAISGPLKAYRESTEGLTTRTNAPLFYGTEQVKLEPWEAALRSLAFNPARIAGIREELWSDTKTAAKWSERKRDINARIKKFYLMPPQERTKGRWAEILELIMEYNDRLRRTGAAGRGVATYITAESIRQSLRMSFKPSRRERFRAARNQ